MFLNASSDLRSLKDAKKTRAICKLIWEYNSFFKKWVAWIQSAPSSKKQR